MSRASFVLKKKTLAFAVSSVLAGWSASGSAEPEAPDKWPPDAAKTIEAGGSAEVPSAGITIKDECTTKTGAVCNVLMKGGTLTNTAVITVEGTGDDTSIVADSENAEKGNTLNNNGTVTVKDGATGVRVKTGPLTLSGSGKITADSVATNTTGVAIAGGELKNASTIEGKGDKAAVEITGVATATATFENGSVVTGSGDSPVAIDASTASGKVTVNINGGTFTGEIKGGTATEDTLNIEATSAEGIKNDVSGFDNINITGAGWTAQGWVSGAATVDASSAIADLYVSDAKPTTPVGIVDTPVSDTLRVVTATATDSNTPTDIKTTGENGKITNLHISGAAQLTLSDGETTPGPATVDSIKVNSADDWQLGSALSGIQTVTASRPASKSSDSDAPTVITEISLVGTGADAAAAAKTLNINSPMPTPEKTAKPVQINAAEPGLIGTLTIGADAQFGAVTNVDDIVITADNWQSTGVVTNPESITVKTSGKVTAIKSVSSTAVAATPVPGSLNVAFNQQADFNDFLDLITEGSGSIGGIDFSNTSDRPSIKFAPTDKKDYENIKGNSAKSDTLVLDSDSLAPTKDEMVQTDFTGIEYNYAPLSVPTNLKRLELMSIKADTNITTSGDATVASSTDDAAPGDGTLSIPFTTAGMPPEFYLKTSAESSATAYSIDFSPENRPTTTFEIAGGTVSELKNVASKKDRLVLSGGTLDSDISTISSLDVNGPSWTASRTFSNLKSINISDEGVLTTLNVAETPAAGSGSPASGGETATAQTLNIQTSSKQQLPVTVAEGGTLDTLNVNTNASLGEVKLQGGTINIADVKDNPSWQLGLVTGAINIQAATHDFDIIKVSKGLTTGSSDNKSLMLNTPVTAVAVNAQGIKTLELGSGAKLATAATVNNLNITDNDWSATGEITMATGEGGIANIKIMEGVNVGSIGKMPVSPEPPLNPESIASQTPSSLIIAFTPKPGAKATAETLKVTTSGKVKGNIDFTTVTDPATVTLEQTGGSINGTISGVQDVIFSGVSSLDGTIGGQVNSVQVKGQLTTMSTGDVAETFTISSLSAPSKETPEEITPPTLDIATGGKLIINRAISVDGSYHQDGEIEIQLESASKTATTPPTNPALVTAKTIDIGPNARVVFDSTNAEKDDVLMTSTEEINRAVTVAATEERYEHFTAVLDKSKMKMVLATQPMGPYVSNLAKSGGAPASAAKALEIASTLGDKKPATTVKTTISTAGDQLNQFVVPLATTPSSAAQLAKQLTPDNTASVVSATRGAQQMASKAIGTRNDNKRTGMNSGDMMESGGFWIQYAYNDATQDEYDGVYGYDAKTHGFTLGMDTGLDDMTDVGLAYTYAKGDISGNGGGSGSSMDTENHIFTLYSAYTQDAMFLDGQLSYSFGDNDGHRSVSGNRVKASYDSSSWGIGLTGGYTLPIDHDWSWQPLGAFNYYRIETDDYSESAPLSYLAYDQVKNDNYSILELGIGVKLMGDIQSDTMVFQPAFSLMAFHDFKDDPVTMTAHYAAGGNSFVVHGAKRDDTRFQFAASVDMELENNMTLTFNYRHDWMDNFKADGFIARLRYEF